MPNRPTHRWRQSRRRCEQNSRLAHDDGFGRQFGKWPNRLQSIAVWLYTTWISINVYNFFNNDVIICHQLSPTSIAQQQLGHDYRRVRSHRQHDATRLRCWQICSDSSTVNCHQLLRSQYTPPTQLNSTVESRRRRVLVFSRLVIVAHKSCYWAKLWSTQPRGELFHCRISPAVTAHSSTNWSSSVPEESFNNLYISCLQWCITACLT